MFGVTYSFYVPPNYHDLLRLFYTWTLSSFWESQILINLRSPEASNIPVACSQFVTNPDPRGQKKSSIKDCTSRVNNALTFTVASIFMIFFYFFKPANKIIFEYKVVFVDYHYIPYI